MVLRNRAVVRCTSMRKAETAPKKLLFLPLIPALALGIVSVASQLVAPTSVATIAQVHLAPAPRAPIDLPPAPVLDVDPCHACVTSA